MFNHVLSWTIPSLFETLSKTILIGFAIEFLTKTEYGYLSIGFLIFTYAGYLQLGTSDGLIIKLPEYYIKKQEIKYVNNINTALTFTLIVMLIFLIFGSILLYFNINNLKLMCAIIGFFVNSVLYQFYYHNLLGNRFKYNFKIVGINKFIIVLFRFLIQVQILRAYGFYGYIICELLLYLMPILVYKVYGKFNLGFHFDKTILFKLFKIGFPIVVLGLIGTLSLTVDRWFIIYLGGIDGLAIYSTAAYLGTLILIIPNQVLSIFSQYTREHYVKNKNQSDIINNYIIYSILIILLCGICILVALHGAHWLIKNRWSDYIDTLNLLGFIGILSLLRIVKSNVNYALIIVDMKRHAITAHVLSLLVSVILCTIAVILYKPSLLDVVLILIIANILHIFILLIISYIKLKISVVNILLLIITLLMQSTFILSGYDLYIVNYNSDVAINLFTNYIILLFLPLLSIYTLYKWNRLDNLLFIINRKYHNDK